MNNEELMHYGVPGMKWGVRKAQDTSSPKANYKRKIKQAKDDYKQANIARAKAKLTRDIEGPQGKNAREKAKSYLMSEAQNKAEKLKSQIDYEDAVERAGKEYRQELRERGQAKKEAAKAARAERKAEASTRRKVTVGVIAATAAVAIGAAIVKKKLGVKGGTSTELYSKYSDKVANGQAKVNNWMNYSNMRTGDTRFRANSGPYADLLKKFKK